MGGKREREDKRETRATRRGGADVERKQRKTPTNPRPIPVHPARALPVYPAPRVTLYMHPLMLYTAPSRIC
jgi:hypothetical protein